MNNMRIQLKKNSQINKKNRGSFLYSQLNKDNHRDDILVLSSEFIEGFNQSNDKASYLKLSGVPSEIKSENNGPYLKLINARIETAWQLGTASPSFGTCELSYLPYSGSLITSTTNLIFTYVSMREKIEKNLIDWLVEKFFSEQET